ncbi:MAG: DUF3307 domain-containing protein [Gemmatimonadota bacterium]|nr:DUF3307 domain-containing protein [Gemmatimonadota bacterium]
MTVDGLGLVAAFLIAHCLGDFSPLSTERMLEAKREARASGIFGHALVHGGLVALVVLVLTDAGLPLAALAAAVEVATHFAIDVARARAGRRWAPLGDVESRAFWYALGVDQLAHGLVLVGIARLVTAG